MEGPDGQLDGKGHEDQREDDQGKLTRDMGLAQHRHVEGVETGIAVEPEDAHQHQGTSEDRVYQELHGRVLSAARAPDADEEVHGQQLDLPEEEEDQEVQGGEDAKDSGLQDEQQGKVFLDPEIDVPGGQDRQKAEHGGQNDQGHTEAVDGQEVLYAKLGYPGYLLHELQRRGPADVEGGEKAQGYEEGHQGEDGRRPPHGPHVVLADEADDYGAQDGQRQENAKVRDAQLILRRSGIRPLWLSRPRR